ncbi:pirin family protein [Methylibium sp.]|uniref:pirin family protein n=1 Tax=Methylibium sp. TaxID=2067992 RepID=UPI0018067478|nr:pirin family protein [Methylibium sp.]MBA3590708.1 pirin family protein [Methylibium sp.]
MKKILSRHGGTRPHWVGDGFPVHTLFSYDSLGRQASPFLMLDYAAPTEFAPGQADKPRGVGQHPHRGFETVTIVYQGELAHRDSTGQGGLIGPGDVQWMTAGAGILHEEFHSPAFTRSGGRLEMVQLWVNLPARDKTAAPGYQTVLDHDIPAVALPGEAGTLRVIAGNYADHRGPARTFTPIDLWDLRLCAGGKVELPVAEGRAAAVLVLHGSVGVNGAPSVGEAQMLLLDRAGAGVTLEAEREATVLLLSGEPIDEPIVGHGPFVMNTQAEIEQAMVDFRSGRFGQIAAARG